MSNMMKVAVVLMGCYVAGALHPRELVTVPFDEYIDDTAHRDQKADGGRALTSRWTKCVTSVNVCVITCRNLIGGMEETLLRLPLELLSSVSVVPAPIAEIAVVIVANDVLPVIHKTKLLLEGFFDSIYGKMARDLYVTVLEMNEVAKRIQGWGNMCIESEGRQCTQMPHVGGFGPCGGRWPCTTTTVCMKPACVQSAEALMMQQGGGQQVGQPNPYGSQPAQYEPQSNEFGSYERPYRPYENLTSSTSNKYGPQPGQHGVQTDEFGSYQRPYRPYENLTSPTSNKYGPQPGLYGMMDKNYSSHPDQHVLQRGQSSDSQPHPLGLKLGHRIHQPNKLDNPDLTQLDSEPDESEEEPQEKSPRKSDTDSGDDVDYGAGDADDDANDSTSSSEQSERMIWRGGE